ncbi:MAG: glycosyl transferase family 2 [Phenylobacterium sp.]|nr:glycosyl transferase family 2 [Phenylobacterium sp.]
MTVSILIPAFRPNFLRQTIASALTQGLEDFELIISDDSGGEELLPIVEQFRDPRIRYVRTSGRIGAAANCRSLWDHAGRDRLLFLLDDDLLMPHAVVEMAAQLDARPDTSFCFAQRYLIDHTGLIIADPPKPREFIVADYPRMARSIVAQMRNPIGEFSNVLINRAVGLTIEDMLYYRGFEMRVMADVAFFLNASRKGPAVGLGVPVGSFRRHKDQNSSLEFNPKLTLIFAEWELFLRGEYSAGTVGRDEALTSAARLQQAYAHQAKQIPAIRIMIPGSDELIQQIGRRERDVLTDEFRADLDRFVAHYEGPDGP